MQSHQLSLTGRAPEHDGGSLAVAQHTMQAGHMTAGIFLICGQWVPSVPASMQSLLLPACACTGEQSVAQAAPLSE